MRCSPDWTFHISDPFEELTGFAGSCPAHGRIKADRVMVDFRSPHTASSRVALMTTLLGHLKGAYFRAPLLLGYLHGVPKGKGTYRCVKALSPDPSCDTLFSLQLVPSGPAPHRLSNRGYCRERLPDVPEGTLDASLPPSLHTQFRQDLATPPLGARTVASVRNPSRQRGHTSQTPLLLVPFELPTTNPGAITHPASAKPPPQGRAKAQKPSPEGLPDSRARPALHNGRAYLCGGNICLLRALENALENRAGSLLLLLQLGAQRLELQCDVPVVWRPAQGQSQ
jgi:hypothetical protein